ncbi:MAG: hypothetical protein WB808_11705 [Candidatus Dormiibacterota bacterium]
MPNFTDDEINGVAPYRLALAQLRRKDYALARRVERALRTYLADRVYPRRQVPWQDTSEGLRARLLFLSENPHLELDCRDVRSALGHRPELLHGGEGDSVWFDVSPPDLGPSGSSVVTDPPHIQLESDAIGTRQFVRRRRASEWIRVHELEATGRVDALVSDDRLPGILLSAEAVLTARRSAHADLSHSSNPHWLRHGLHEGVPLDDAVACLCARHRLPCVRNGVIATRISEFLVTEETECLVGIELPEALLEIRDSTDDVIVGSFALKVGGIDEYVTKKDMEWICTNVIRPRQERLLRARGAEPEGNFGPQLATLQAALPLYRRIVMEGIALPDAVKADQLAETSEEKPDRRSVARQLRELRQLLTPR